MDIIIALSLTALISMMYARTDTWFIGTPWYGFWKFFKLLACAFCLALILNSLQNPSILIPILFVLVQVLHITYRLRKL